MKPVSNDRDSGPFFAAAREGRLVYRACNACGHGIHPPVPDCPFCGSSDAGWRDARGTGRLHSWTTVTYQIHPDYPVPYTVVLVTLDDSADVRLVGRLDDAPALTVDQPMAVWFETQADGTILPQWKPA